MTKPYVFLTAGLAALLLAVLALSPMSLLAGTTSSTSIEAGQTFIFAGEQRMALAVAARNDGEVPVEILLLENGNERSVATIAPAASMKLTVPARTVALFRNASSKKALMHLKFNGSASGLTMGYKAN
jgi:hypothetical protein